MKNKYELGRYYEDSENRIIKLIGITNYHKKYYATIYDCILIRDGKYPSINRNPIMSYTKSAMSRCKKLSNAEIMAITL